MSLTREINVSTSNPTVAFVKWKAGKGFFEAYIPSTGVREDLGGKISFITLDQLSGVGGYVRNKGMYTSNEVHDITKQELKVWLRDGDKTTDVYEGLYSAGKDKLKAQGVKFRKIVYGMLTEDAGSLSASSVIKLELQGASMTAWFEANIGDGRLVSVSDIEHVEGAISYFVPKYETAAMPSDWRDAAKDADRELQEFFDSFKSPIEETEEEIPF